MEINNHIIKKLVYTRASMLIIIANVVRNLGIMHMVIKSKFYEIGSQVVTQVMGLIIDLLIHVEKVVCKMDFMVMDNDWWDLLFRLDSLIKIGIVVDIEQQLIQIHHGLGANVQILPSNMVNMF
jgi:hypothetical protein